MLRAVGRACAVVMVRAARALADADGDFKPGAELEAFGEGSGEEGIVVAPDEGGGGAELSDSPLGFERPVQDARQCVHWSLRKQARLRTRGGGGACEALVIGMIVPESLKAGEWFDHAGVLADLSLSDANPGTGQAKTQGSSDDLRVKRRLQGRAKSSVSPDAPCPGRRAYIRAESEV